MNKILGIVLLIVGIGLVIVGFNASDSFASEVSETVTGNPTDETIWYLIGGVVAAVVGIVLLMRPARALT